MPTGVYGTRIAVDADMKKAIMDRVDIDPVSGCWNWKLKSLRNGYGQITIGKQSDGTRQIARQAHRVSYEAFVGKIPNGMQLDHLCRNRKYVFFAHLEPVTNRVNTIRGNGAAGKHARQTHCKHGHEFTPENIYHETTRYGWPRRKCRACHCARQNNKRLKERLKSSH